MERQQIRLFYAIQAYFKLISLKLSLFRFLLAHVKDLDQSQQNSSRCSDLADRITGLVENINSLKFDRKQHNSAFIQIHTCAVMLWNLAVSMKASGKNCSKSVNARCKSTFRVIYYYRLK